MDEFALEMRKAEQITRVFAEFTRAHQELICIKCIDVSEIITLIEKEVDVPGADYYSIMTNLLLFFEKYPTKYCTVTHPNGSVCVGQRTGGKQKQVKRLKKGIQVS